MRKTYKLWLVGILVTVGFLIPQVRPMALACSMDSANTTAIDSSSAALTISTEDKYYGQTFKLNEINKLKFVYVFFKNFSAPVNLTISIYKDPWGTPQKVTELSGTFNPELYFDGDVNLTAWIPIDFSESGGVTLRQNTLYALYITKDGGEGSPMWARSSSDTYADGTSIKSGLRESDDDFSFQMCGDYEAPTGEPKDVSVADETPLSDTTTTSDQDQNSTEGDSQTTSSENSDSTTTSVTDDNSTVQQQPVSSPVESDEEDKSIQTILEEDTNLIILLVGVLALLLVTIVLLFVALSKKANKAVVKTVEIAEPVANTQEPVPVAQMAQSLPPLPDKVV